MRKRSSNWQKIIWREWRNCDDQEYANHLFDLVADEPMGWKGTVTLVFIGMVYGAMADLGGGAVGRAIMVRNKRGVI